MDDNTATVIIIGLLILFWGFRTWVNRNKPNCECTEDDL